MLGRGFRHLVPTEICMVSTTSCLKGLSFRTVGFYFQIHGDRFDMLAMETKPFKKAVWLLGSTPRQPTGYAVAGSKSRAVIR